MASKLKVTDENATLIQVNEDVRVERRFVAEPDGTYKWTIYERVHTGVEFHDEKANKARHATAHDRLRDHNGVVRHEHVKKMGKHPVIEHEGKPAETNEPFIYVPKGEASSKDDALKIARELAGGK